MSVPTPDSHAGELPPALVATPSLARWIRFPEDGRVLAQTGKVEIGQGLMTALAIIVAEELDVAVERVSVASAHTGHTPDEGVTAGSMSIETSGAALRQASAWARRLLLARASERLGVEAERLTVEDGEVSAPGVNERVDYWELARRWPGRGDPPAGGGETAVCVHLGGPGRPSPGGCRTEGDRWGVRA